MSKYTIGVDFGTLAVRALVVDVANGRELACAVYNYPHAVMTEALPDGTLLKPEWALQHPMDYVEGIYTVVPRAMEQAQICADDVIGLGIDFTSSTSLPVDKNGTPLCLKEKFKSNPYAWPMLWKHHAAQDYANRMTEVARERNESFLQRCGGKISSEMMFPRLWQIAVESPEVYEAADQFVEAGDWIIHQLTGSCICSMNPASYKLFWTEEDGYPDDEFFSALDSRLHDVTSKVGSTLLPLGSCGGKINEYGMRLTGLKKDTPVSVTCIDAHTALPAAGVAEEGKMLLILGTSGAHLVLNEKEHEINGILCMAKDGMIPGWYAYEAGQSCCGDHFKWFIDQLVPTEYEVEAQKRQIGVHQLLTERAEWLRPGQSGLLALDWWNGNRSVLMDAELSGLLIGMTLQTKPEEIYRALIEATAYGTREIVENFENAGIKIDEIYVCGGIAKKNPMLMQIYADVLRRTLKIVRSDQANALGTAIFAAVAAGKERGGYESIQLAAHAMGGTERYEFHPILCNSVVYDELYAEYQKLHDLFGHGENDVMHRLRMIRHEQSK